MTQREVRVGQEGAGHLGPTPLPVSAVKLNIAQRLANLDCFILIVIGERYLEDDLILEIRITFRHPEL